MSYPRKKLKEIWKKAPECHCDRNNCHPNSHRLCYRCQKTILFGAYWQENSKFRWDVDHIKPKSKGGPDNTSNLKPCHIKCNREKGNK